MLHCQTLVGIFVENCLVKKIFPNISPNKTLEGYIGGFLISFTAILLTYEKFLNETLFTTVIIFTIFIMLSFIGDLYISLIKRIHSLEILAAFYLDMVVY
ncbi:MAG: hypothetical protein CM15mP93_08570 [Thiotrichaceae bacterium]|nr:MAG: hypothetical protein CM15mP93_08570 [Thiotrichaceae bacterium]